MLKYSKLKSNDIIFYKGIFYMKSKTKILYFIPAIIVTIIIFGLSTRSIEASNAQSGLVTESVFSIFGAEGGVATGGSFKGIGLDIINQYVRALAHVLEFGGLGLMIILGCFLNGFTKKQYIKLTLIWGSLTAFTDETIQFFTPGRTADFLDIAKDLTGILSALLVAYIIHQIYLARTKAQKLLKQQIS